MSRQRTEYPRPGVPSQANGPTVIVKHSVTDYGTRNTWTTAPFA
jgi:hypothetical protein